MNGVVDPGTVSVPLTENVALVVESDELTAAARRAAALGEFELTKVAMTTTTTIALADIELQIKRR